MNKNPRITLLGNNSGRNLGDAAILASILDILTQEIPNVRFYVPSISPKFIDDNYGAMYKAKGVNILPWTGSLRLLGIPTLYCLAKSDLALICDGIIFGRNLFSPHNFLITLFFLVPWARLCKCKLICYSCGIGPFPSTLSEMMARYVINSCDLIIMRDHDSKVLAQKIGVTKPIEVTGDAAFLNKVSDDDRARHIALAEGIDLNRPILGINVTPYIDSWLKQNERVEDKSKFLTTIADGILLARKNYLQMSEIQFVIFSTSPMDEAYSYTLARMVGGRVIHNSKYLSHDIQSIMKKCELFVGMRFHSLVLASSVGVPIVGLVYAPKVRSFLSLLESREFGEELKEIVPESLSQKIGLAWENRVNLSGRQGRIIEMLKQGARESAKKIKKKYFDVN